MGNYDSLLFLKNFLKVDSGFEVINDRDKLLVFSTGELGPVPHQIGVKRLSKVDLINMTNFPNYRYSVTFLHQVRFREHMDLSMGLRERVQERRRRRRERERQGNVRDEEEVK